MAIDRYKVLKQKIKDQKLRVLFYDIETSPMLVWTFMIGQKVSLQHGQIEKESKVISIQYKFEGDEHAKALHWDRTGNPSEGDDSSMLEEFVHILNSANVVIGQNSRSFDQKVLNWRLNVLNLTPVTDVVMLDTLTLARNSFRAPSNKLDYRSSVYGFGGKHKMEFQDWIDVVKGDDKKLQKMLKYGIKDVEDTQKLFWKELPYYRSLPISLAALVKEPKEAKPSCPRCAAAKQKKFDVYPTASGNKLRFTCRGCGHIWKDSKQLKEV